MMKQTSSTKIWRRLFIVMAALLLCFVMIFGICACGSEGPYIGEDGYWYVNGEKTEYKAACGSAVFARHGGAQGTIP